MQRSLWRGAISFGLIYVPVDLYSASKEGALALHLLCGGGWQGLGQRGRIVHGAQAHR
jgi:hypothetical protein